MLRANASWRAFSMFGFETVSWLRSDTYLPCRHWAPSHAEIRARLREIEATYIPHRGASFSGNMNPSQLGNVLPNGEDYRQNEVETLMEQLWAEYVAANPRLFEVHD